MVTYKHIKIADHRLTEEAIAYIRMFLVDQPHWHYPKESEVEKGKGWRVKEGVKQHWLWMAKNQATSWEDFNTWPQQAVDRRHLIMPGELFLCDLVGGELWVGRMGHKKAEKLYQISDDMNRDYGNCFNGYAVVPLDEAIQKYGPLTGLDPVYDRIKIKDQWVCRINKRLIPRRLVPPKILKELEEQGEE